MSGYGVFDTVVQRTTGKTIEEHIIDGVGKAMEQDKKVFEEYHKDALEAEKWEPWVTEDLDSGHQPCSIF